MVTLTLVAAALLWFGQYYLVAAHQTGSQTVQQLAARAATIARENALQNGNTTSQADVIARTTRQRGASSRMSMAMPMGHACLGQAQEQASFELKLQPR